MPSELVDLNGVLRGESDSGMAWRVIIDGKAVWLPKSQVEDNGDGTWTMPRWLAEEKELV